MCFPLNLVVSYAFNGIVTAMDLFQRIFTHAETPKCNHAHVTLTFIAESIELEIGITCVIASSKPG